MITAPARHPAERHGEVAGDLVAQIIAGKLPPMARLPRWRELAATYGTTMPTVQKALARLEAAGYIKRHGWAGARVVAQPPHLYHLGLVFMKTLRQRDGAPTSRYWDALARAAATPGAAGPARVSIYEQVYDATPTPGSQRLAADLALRACAGLVFVDAYPLFNPLWEHLRTTRALPLVTLMASGLPGLPWVHMDTRTLVQRGLAHLAAQGCQRVAVLTLAQVGDAFVQQVAAQLQALGRPPPPGWIFGFPPNETRWLQTWLALLHDRPPTQWPDGFLVTDDHLTAGLATGLAALGRPPGAALPVVSHCNFPLPDGPLPAGITWLGYDQHTVLATAWQIIQAARTTTPPAVCEIPPVFAPAPA